MSSILKALEKAEESHSTRRNGGDGGLIRARKQRPTWVMPVAVLCGAAVATLVTFAAMGGFSRQAQPAPVAQVAQVPAVGAKTAPVIVAPLNPVTELPAVMPEQALPNQTLPSQMLPSQMLPSQPAGVLVAPSPKVPPLPALQGKAVRSAAVPVPHPAAAQRAPVQAAPVQAAPAQAASEPEVAPAHTGPVLKVTGIAWQNNGESSFAVVNGRAVLQGGMVDGFKVMEIHHDMVRFSGSGGTIDVPLGDENN
jgi:general secretion pathway protein B